MSRTVGTRTRVLLVMTHGSQVQCESYENTDTSRKLTPMKCSVLCPDHIRCTYISTRSVTLSHWSIYILTLCQRNRPVRSTIGNGGADSSTPHPTPAWIIKRKISMTDLIFFYDWFIFGKCAYYNRALSIYLSRSNRNGNRSISGNM